MLDVVTLLVDCLMVALNIAAFPIVGVAQMRWVEAEDEAYWAARLKEQQDRSAEVKAAYEALSRAQRALRVRKKEDLVVASRAKKPPDDATKQLASVVLDALLEKRSADVAEDLTVLLPLAVSEYLRLQPRARSGDGRLWQYRMDHQTKECHFVCLFCRESLNTLPWGKPVTEYMAKKFVTHAQICAMRLLAGHIKGTGPQELMEG